MQESNETGGIMGKAAAGFSGPLLGLLVLLVFPSVGLGDIYKYVDANGVIHFTDRPTHNQFSLYLKEKKKEKSEVLEIISRYASQFQLEEALVNAVIKVESDYNPSVVSRKGAQGMMQLMPQTARELDVRDPLNPEDNIRGGTRYLRQMLDRFKDLDLALAAYNAGPSAVSRYGGIPPYEETRNYVIRVKKYLQQYRQDKESYL
jgi:soluble lytic murein transglycosylase